MIRTDSSEAEEDIPVTKAMQNDSEEKTIVHGHLGRKNKMRGGKKTVVTFDNQVVVRLIRGHKELSEQEKDEMWYSSIDLQKIRGETRTTLCLMNTKTEIPSNFEERFCTRGLEGRTRKAIKSRSRIRDDVWTAVFEEQSVQRAESSIDPLAIAKVAILASRPAKQTARKTALRDEVEAQEWKDSSPMSIGIPISATMMKPIELCRWPLW